MSAINSLLLFDSGSFSNPGFNPLNVPGCVLWLDGNDPAGDGIKPADGSSINLWADKSTKGYDFSQSSGANQPTFTLNAVNSLSSLTFDGDNFSMFKSYETDLNQLSTTIFIVAVDKWTALRNNFACPMASRAGNPSTVYGYNFYRTPSPGSPSLTNQLLLGSNGPGFNLITATTSILNVPRLLSLQVTGVRTGSFILNNTNYGGMDFYPEVGSGFQSVTRIGAGTPETTPNFYWIGYICEIVMYTPAISPADYTNVTNYLYDKWGIV